MSDETRLLEPAEAIRRRPGFFLHHSSDEDGGVHDLLWEVIGNAIDLHRSGLASELHVELRADGWVVVRDDGPGIPIEYVRGGPSVLELVFVGCHGGISMWTERMNLEPTPTMRGEGVNGLSTRTEVETTRAGVRWAVMFERGKVLEPLRALGPATTPGTTIRFLPDPMMFESPTLDPQRIADRLQQLAWVRPALRVFFQGRQFHGRGGLRDWASQLAGEQPEALVATTCSVGGVTVDVAMAWITDGEPTIYSFANARPTPSGGTHVDGLWRGLETFATRASAGASSPANLARGLIALIDVELEEPRYSDHSHDALSNTEVLTAVESIVLSTLSGIDRGDRFLERRLG